MSCVQNKNHKLYQRISTKFVFAFLTVAVSAFIVTLLAVNSMQGLVGNTVKLYQHPYSVSTAALRIRGDISEIQRSMDELMLSNSTAETQQLEHHITKRVTRVLEDMKVLDERFLGDKQKVSELHQQFLGWQPLREKVLRALHSGEPDYVANDAIHAAGQYADTVALKVDGFITFAEGKAQEFVGTAKQASTRAITFIAITSCIAIVLLAAIFWMVYRSVMRPIGGEPEAIASLVHRASSGEMRLFANDKVCYKSGIAGSIRAMVQRVGGIVGELRDCSNLLSASAEEIAHDKTELSKRTDAQATALESTATTIGEFTETVEHNAESARHADELVKVAERKAENTGEIMTRAITAMREIEESSQKIADIVNVIDEIAFQTNLLALNAAVEAARAGDHGRGFAVVAMEVRNLAQRSAESAKEIKQLIEDSVAKVTDGTLLANQSGDALRDIIDSVQSVSHLVSEIATAGEQQSEGIHRVTQSIARLDNLTQENSELVHRTAKASETVDEQARMLMQKLEFFRIDGRSQSAGNTGHTNAFSEYAAPQPQAVKLQEAVPTAEDWAKFV